MLVEELSELVIRPVSAAIRTDEDRWDIDYVIDIIDVAAAWAKSEKFKTQRNIPEQWFYTKTITRNPLIQEDNYYTIYEIPEMIVLPFGFSGISYVRGSNGKTLPLYKTMAEYLNAKDNPNLGDKKDKDVAVIVGNTIRIYGTSVIKNIEVCGLFTNLLADNNFNLRFDDYPVTRDLVWLINTFIINQYMNTGAIRPVNMKPDSQDMPTEAAIK